MRKFQENQLKWSVENKQLRRNYWTNQNYDQRQTNQIESKITIQEARTIQGNSKKIQSKHQVA